MTNSELILGLIPAKAEIHGCREYGLIGLVILTFLAGLGVRNQASAESASEAMQIFGLIGTWATDCAWDMEHGGRRLTFSAPFLGSPTMMDSIGGKYAANAKSKISAARRVTEDKIKLTVVADREQAKLELVIARFDKKIRIIERRTMDKQYGKILWDKDGFSYEIIAGPGTTVIQTGKRMGETLLLEKCLN